MKRALTFFTQMDKQALRSVAVLLVMFAIVAALIWFARDYVNYDQSALAEWLSTARESGWGLPLTVLLFVLAGLIGAPQWILIAAAIVAFGPAVGGLYAWISTLISASLQFRAAKFIGAKRLERVSSEFTNRFIQNIRLHGFWTSFAVRLVPTGPFILVNLAAGVSGMRFAAFIGGTALGIIPKILLVVMIAQGFVSAAQQRFYLILFAAAALALMLLMLAARKYLRGYISDTENFS